MQGYKWTMVALVLLLCQVTAETQESNCSTMTIVTNKRTVLQSVHIRNNKILTVQSANECMDLCCKNLSSCTVAEFNLISVHHNCIHVYCQPPESCVDATQNGNNDSVVFMMKYKKKLNESSKTAVTERHVIVRTIKPRKGVELIQYSHLPHSLKAVNLTATTPSEKNSDLQLETSTSNLQLGTNTQSLIWTISNSSSATTHNESMTYTTPHTMPEFSIPHLDPNDNKHSVPKKGASDTKWTRITMSTFITQPNQISTTPFQTIEELQSATEKLLRNPTIVYSSNDPIINVSTTEKNTLNITEEIAFQKYSANDGFKNLKELEKTTVNLQSNVKFNSENDMTIFATKSKDIPKDSNFINTTFSTVPPNVYLVMTKEELYLEQSIYLIVSLIIGFLILLLVIGLVLKHIHGVWERRHYQRMDFLIDGMYNSV